MNVEESVTSDVVGAFESMFLMIETEKGPIPLFTVASIAPFGASASPNGLGALTATSRPAGVTRRPLGSTAASKQSMLMWRAAGSSPAGALNSMAFELLEPWSSWPFEAIVDWVIAQPARPATTATSATGAMSVRCVITDLPAPDRADESTRVDGRRRI